MNRDSASIGCLQVGLLDKVNIESNQTGALAVFVE